MPIPEYVVALRRHIGTSLLWLPGITAVVVRGGSGGSAEVLLVRRADNGQWTPVTGIVTRARTRTSPPCARSPRRRA